MSNWTDEQAADDELNRLLRDSIAMLASGPDTTAPLTAHDRCDACQAAAQSRFHRPPRAILEFCAHHYRKHRVQLLSEDWTVAIKPNGKVSA